MEQMFTVLFALAACVKDNNHMMGAALETVGMALKDLHYNTKSPVISDSTAMWTIEVADWVVSEYKISCIKAYRNAMNEGLREAKTHVDNLAVRGGQLFPNALHTGQLLVAIDSFRAGSSFPLHAIHINAVK